MKTRSSILSYPILIAFMLMIFSHKVSAQNFSQFYLSEVWDKEGGQMPIFYKNATTTDGERNVYVVGATASDTSGYDILIQKFDAKGDLLWENHFDGGANLNDMGADVFVDDENSVFVVGAATQNSSDNFDLVVVKYSEDGTFEWSYFYNFGGFPLPYDAGTAIIGDNMGAIFVTGASAGDSTLMDYVTIKLTSDVGSLEWVNRYDYIQLNEIPTKIKLQDTLVVVTGASQINMLTNSWELASVRYFAESGNYGGDGRTSGNSLTGADEANDLTIDIDGNILVLGAAVDDTTGFNMGLYKFNDDLDLLWEQHFDGYGLEDKGYGVKTDAQGNVYAVGYVTNPNQGKNYSILKYDSTGTLQWSREFNGLANLDDEAVQLVVRGDRIFVTGAARNNANSQITTMGFTADGQIFSVKSFDSPFGQNDKPTAMGIDLDDNLIIVGQIQENDTTFRNVTVKYNVMEKPIVPVYIDSVPAYNARELIVRFDKSAMNLEAVDKKNFDAGLLKDFVHGYVIDSLNAKFPFDAGRLQTFKIFHRMTTADSLSITRLGDTIPVPAFWATLSVMFPEEYDLIEAIDTLNTMKPMVHYGEVNGFGSLLSDPDDTFYPSGQSGLNDLTHGINIEMAWSLQVGKDYTRVGVLDTGIKWQHWEFSKSYNSPVVTWEDSRVEGGWDYTTSPPTHPSHQDSVQNFSDMHGHGTAVAGIIGATKNNEFCIAGIASGFWNEDDELREDGCSLYTLKILNPGNPPLVSNTIAADAIFDASSNIIENQYNLALHILNNSWGNNEFSQLLEEQILFCFRNNAVFVAGSGNTFNEFCLNSDPYCIMYPANYEDQWVVRVGANNANSLTADFSVRANNLDFVAPGTTGIYRSLGDGFEGTPAVSDCSYNQPGTSFAAPHVSGTAALMISQHNLLNEEADYPNNLAPEDVEKILKLTAKDITGAFPYQVGPDIISGYGIINAGEAVLQVSLPYYYVQHNGDLLSQDYSLVDDDVNIIIQNTLCSNNLSAGSYQADRYVVNHLYANTLPVEYAVVNHWGRPGSTDGYSNSNTLNCHPWLVYNYIESEIGTERLIEVQTTTYCYHITQDGNGNPLDVWIPTHPSQARAAYSLHIRTDAPIDLGLNSENDVLDLILYPNPNNGNEVFLKGIPSSYGDYEIRFANLSGKTVLESKENNLENTKIDISSLEAGFYIVEVRINNNIYFSNFIKL